MRQVTANEIRESMQLITEGLGESEDWRDKKVKNPATGNMVKISSLSAKEQDRYRPKSTAKKPDHKAPDMDHLEKMSPADHEKHQLKHRAKWQAAVASGDAEKASHHMHVASIHKNMASGDKEMAKQFHASMHGEKNAAGDMVKKSISDRLKKAAPKKPKPTNKFKENPALKKARLAREKKIGDEVMYGKGWK